MTVRVGDAIPFSTIERPVSKLGDVYAWSNRTHEHFVTSTDGRTVASVLCICSGHALVD